MIDQCMYAERERKSNFITIFFLPVGSIPEADGFLAGCGRFHGHCSSNSSCLVVGSPKFRVPPRLLRAIPTTLPTIAREGSQL